MTDLKRARSMGAFFCYFRTAALGDNTRKSCENWSHSFCEFVT